MGDRLVLVVDGDSSLRGLIAEVLRDAGANVVQVEDGEQALALARQRRPDAILVNHLLPGMSGLCLIRQLKDDPITRLIPTVLLSGRFHQLTDQGVADRVVALPFDIDALQEQVEAVIAASAMTVA